MEDSKVITDSSPSDSVEKMPGNLNEQNGSIKSSKSSEELITNEINDCSSVKPEKQSTDSTSVDTALHVVGSSNDAGFVYEKIDGVYHYTNPTTNVRYKYDDVAQDWALVANEKSSESINGQDVNSDATEKNDVHVDDEGRTFYHADGHYLCRDPTGHVYYMNENQEWVLWSDGSTSTNNNPIGENNNENKWYFYKGEDAFYRDNSTNTVFKLNKETNEWCRMKSRSKRKKASTSRSTAGGEEEFDTESSDDNEEQGYESEENEAVSGDVPPGYNKDPSISFEDGSFIKRDKDGMMYDWDKHRRAWFPKLDETFMAKYQMSYGFNPDGSKNENPVKYDDDEEEEEDLEEQAREKERKQKEEEKKKKEKKHAGWFEADDAHNTKVYVSQLPEDTTEQQFVDLMQKCGLVLKDPESGKYKVKLYKDKEGNFKGDALCTYIKVESVSLALQILDGSCVSANSTQRIRVERAKFQMRGDYDASLKPKKKKKKLIEKLQKKQEKLFAWTPEPLRGQRAKNESVVIIRNAFTPAEFVDHAERILSHTESLRAQCASFGAVKKLELYDRHSEGVVKVMFTEVEAADLCIASMHKRLYNGRQLSVAVWDGAESFRVEETEEEKAERLKKWDEFLMKGGDGTQKTSPKTSQAEEKSAVRENENEKSSSSEIDDQATLKENENTSQEMNKFSEETSS